MKDRPNVTLTSLHIESFKKVVGESFVFADEESVRRKIGRLKENLIF